MHPLALGTLATRAWHAYVCNWRKPAVPTVCRIVRSWMNCRRTAVVVDRLGLIRSGLSSKPASWRKHTKRWADIRSA